jgi:GNAT superfamily N-acetyltransferase
MATDEQGVSGFIVSTDPARLDLTLIHDFLSRSYWAHSISGSVVEKSISGSICFGVYAGSRQVGFARVVTDRATFAYLADVFIVEVHRRKGLSKLLMEAILSHPDLQGLRRFLLATKDAHGLYEKFGFRPLAVPERFLEIFRPDVYGAGAPTRAK